ncbi:hypothetical protein [Adlercreutzia sp. ZJ473]|uniref:hypothetical protein n=1 Tax=Adlercreutzia sp. ZJ473 TaxID=2722822 RepID=UPI001552F4EA|nr:hypothetical protein [Adlercreutzia sp. ZJ473]
MQNPPRIDGGKQEAIRYRSGRFATIPASLIEFLVRVKVGRSGFAVIASLCRYVTPNGTFKAFSREKMSRETTLTPAQVSRGMAELKEKLVIEPVPRASADGRWRPDRSNFGHVATYRFTDECWRFISRDLP